VWKNTGRLGVASSQRKDNKYVVVFRYDPPGNYNTKTAYQQNVLPPPVKAAATKPRGYQTPVIITTSIIVWSGIF